MRIVLLNICSSKCICAELVKSNLCNSDRSIIFSDFVVTLAMLLRRINCRFIYLLLLLWLGGVVVRALDLRLDIAGSIPAAALSSATLDKLFTHIVQRL